MMNRQILYKYVKVETEQFAIFEENIKQDVTDSTFQVETYFSFNQAQGVLANCMMVIVLQQSSVVLKIAMVDYFKIAEESLSALTNDNRIEFPQSFLQQLASLSFGTLRGVLVAKTEGTKLNNLILPPTYIGNLIDKNWGVYVDSCG